MRSKTNNHGYTLMEVVIVVAVIAVLAAVLVPITVRCKAKAQQSTCASNLRQLGTAITLYIQNNDRRLPLYANQIPEPGQVYPQTIPDAELLHRSLARYVPNDKVWFCPSDVVAGKAVMRWEVYHLYSSYFFNFRSNPAKILDDGYHFGSGTVLQPKLVPIIKDANMIALDPPGGADEHVPTPGCQRFNGINIWWLDGHISWRLMSCLEEQGD